MVGAMWYNSDGEMVQSPGIFEATPEFLAQEIDAIFTDIYPDAVKIGMVSSAELIGVSFSFLKKPLRFS